MYVEHLHLRRSFAFCRVWGSHEDHDLHIHDCLEIGVLLKNKLDYRFGDRTYKGNPGDVFLCRPFEPHWSYADQDQPFECILVLFTPSLLRRIPNGNQLVTPFYSKYHIPPMIPANTTHAKAICKAASLAMLAQEQNKEAWVTRQYMHLIDILLQVNDFTEAHKRPSSEQPIPSSEVITLIGDLLDNFQKPIDIETLASQAGIGRTMFFNEFRTLTGLSPKEFLNRLRIQNAMDLLHITNKSMIDIAYESGFQSLSTFNKQFKRYTGKSPRQYRKKE